ncbi:hypothetical protein, partial [Leptobacterium sp. I13]|uniref:hypothetical protein n=1 Tax=Leptobacterium meishanense TaxID=3128904 RepID=UPI0030EF5A5D
NLDLTVETLKPVYFKYPVTELLYNNDTYDISTLRHTGKVRFSLPPEASNVSITPSGPVNTSLTLLSGSTFEVAVARDSVMTRSATTNIDGDYDYGFTVNYTIDGQEKHVQVNGDVPPEREFVPLSLIVSRNGNVFSESSGEALIFDMGEMLVTQPLSLDFEFTLVNSGNGPIRIPPEYFELVNTAGESVIAPNQANGISITWPASILSDTTRIEAGESYKFPGTVAVLNPIQLQDLINLLSAIDDNVDAGGGGTPLPFIITITPIIIPDIDPGSGTGGDPETGPEEEEIVKRCDDGGDEMVVTVGGTGVGNGEKVSRNLNNAPDKIGFKISNCDGHVDEQGKPKDIIIYSVEISGDPAIFGPVEFAAPQPIIPGGRARGSFPINVDQMVQDAIYTAAVTIESNEGPFSFNLEVFKDDDDNNGRLIVLDGSNINLDPSQFPEGADITTTRAIAFENRKKRPITLRKEFFAETDDGSMANGLTYPITIEGANELIVPPSSTLVIGTLNVTFSGNSPGDFSATLTGSDTEGTEYTAPFSGNVKCDDQFSLERGNGDVLKADSPDTFLEFDLLNQETPHTINLFVKTEGIPINVDVTLVPRPDLQNNDRLTMDDTSISHTIVPGNDGVIRLEIETHGLAGQRVQGLITFNNDRPDCFKLENLWIDIEVTGTGDENGFWELTLTDMDDQPIPDEGVVLKTDPENTQNVLHKILIDNQSNSDVTIEDGGPPYMFLSDEEAPEGVDFYYQVTETSVGQGVEPVVHAPANRVTYIGDLGVEILKNAKTGDFRVTLNAIDTQGNHKTETLRGTIVKEVDGEYTIQVIARLVEDDDNTLFIGQKDLVFDNDVFDFGDVAFDPAFVNPLLAFYITIKAPDEIPITVNKESFTFELANHLGQLAQKPENLIIQMPEIEEPVEIPAGGSKTFLVQAEMLPEIEQELFAGNNRLRLPFRFTPVDEETIIDDHLVTLKPKNFSFEGSILHICQISSETPCPGKQILVTRFSSPDEPEERAFIVRPNDVTPMTGLSSNFEILNSGSFPLNIAKILISGSDGYRLIDPSTNFDTPLSTDFDNLNLSIPSGFSMFFSVARNLGIDDEALISIVTDADNVPDDAFGEFRFFVKPSNNATPFDFFFAQSEETPISLNAHEKREKTNSSNIYQFNVIDIGEVTPRTPLYLGFLFENILSEQTELLMGEFKASINDQVLLQKGSESADKLASWTYSSYSGELLPSAVNSISPGGYMNFEVEFIPENLEGFFEVEVWFTSKIKGQNNIKEHLIVLRGTAVESSAIDYTFSLVDGGNKIDLCEESGKNCDLKLAYYDTAGLLQEETILATPIESVAVPELIWVYASENTSNLEEFTVSYLGKEGTLFEETSADFKPPAIGAIGNFWQTPGTITTIPIGLKMNLREQPFDPFSRKPASGNLNLILKRSDNTVLGRLPIIATSIPAPILSYQMGFQSIFGDGDFVVPGGMIDLDHVDLAFGEPPRIKGPLRLQNEGITIFDKAVIVTEVYLESSDNIDCVPDSFFKLQDPTGSFTFCSSSTPIVLFQDDENGEAIVNIQYGLGNPVPGEYSDVLFIEYINTADVVIDDFTGVRGEPEVFTAYFNLSATVHAPPSEFVPQTTISASPSGGGAPNALGIGSNLSIPKGVTQDLTITNTGDAALEISSMNVTKVSDGALITGDKGGYALSHNTLSIPPGGEATFSITNLSASCDPDQLGYVEIITNDPLKEKYHFTVSCYNLPDQFNNIHLTQGSNIVEYGHNDTNAYSFPETELGVPLSRTFRVYNDGNAVFDLVNLKASPGFRVNPAPFSLSIPPGEYRNFFVEYPAEATGTTSGQVTFERAGFPGEPFIFNIEGTASGATTAMGIRQGGGTWISEGDVFDFGTSSAFPFRIYNLGYDHNLNINSID